MTKNPFLNASIASLYIITIVTVINSVMGKGVPQNQFVAPIAMISLFTLSAAVMGYLFLYQPGMLYMDGKKKAAVTLFLQTVGVFAALTAIVFILLFSRLLG